MGSYWLLVIGYWLLVIGYWLLVIGYWLLVIGYWLLVIGYWLFGGKNTIKMTIFAISWGRAKRQNCVRPFCPASAL